MPTRSGRIRNFAAFDRTVQLALQECPDLRQEGPGICFNPIEIQEVTARFDSAERVELEWGPPR